MTELNAQQRRMLKTIESKDDRKKIKKLFLKENDKKEMKDSKKVLSKLFKKFYKK